MTKVLLTGAGGFVGSHVLETLLVDTEWDIVVVDSFRHNGGQDRIFEVVQPYGAFDRVHLVAHNLTAPFTNREVAQIGRPDYILSVASACSVPESIQYPAEFVRNNIETMLTVLEFARGCWTWQGTDVRVTPHRLVQVSTDEVFGPAKDLDDGHLMHAPSSPYSASKAAQEDLARAWAVTFGVPVTLVNSANMFGERQSQLAFIPRVIRAMLAGEAIPIHTWQGTPGRRCYSYVRNVAQRLVDLVTSEEHRTVAGAAIDREVLPGQCEIDNLTLAQRIADLIGRPLGYELVEGRAVRPGYDPQYPSLGDANWAELGFDDGLERTVKWFVDHPDWLL